MDRKVQTAWTVIVSHVRRLLAQPDFCTDVGGNLLTALERLDRHAAMGVTLDSMKATEAVDGLHRLFSATVSDFNLSERWNDRERGLERWVGELCPLDPETESRDARFQSNWKFWSDRFGSDTWSVTDIKFRNAIGETGDFRQLAYLAGFRQRVTFCHFCRLCSLLGPVKEWSNAIASFSDGCPFLGHDLTVASAERLHSNVKRNVFGTWSLFVTPSGIWHVSLLTDNGLICRPLYGKGTGISGWTIDVRPLSCSVLSSSSSPSSSLCPAGVDQWAAFFSGLLGTILLPERAFDLHLPIDAWGGTASTEALCTQMNLCFANDPEARKIVPFTVRWSNSCPHSLTVSYMTGVCINHQRVQPTGCGRQVILNGLTVNLLSFPMHNQVLGQADRRPLHPFRPFPLAPEYPGPCSRDLLVAPTAVRYLVPRQPLTEMSDDPFSQVRWRNPISQIYWTLKLGADRIRWTPKSRGMHNVLELAYDRVLSVTVRQTSEQTVGIQIDVLSSSSSSADGNRFARHLFETYALNVAQVQEIVSTIDDRCWLPYRSNLGRLCSSVIKLTELVSRQKKDLPVPCSHVLGDVGLFAQFNSALELDHHGDLKLITDNHAFADASETITMPPYYALALMVRAVLSFLAFGQGPTWTPGEAVHLAHMARILRQWFGNFYVNARCALVRRLSAALSARGHHDHHPSDLDELLGTRVDVSRLAPTEEKNDLDVVDVRSDSVRQAFELGTPVGEGVFGQVRKCRFNGQTVAIKRISVQTSFDVSEMCALEAKLQDRQRHCNVVRLVTHCAENDFQALVTEWVEMGSLEDWISKPLDRTIRLQIASGICRGLQHIHTHDILHLDLKPANILLTVDFVPKITDFGLSRTRQEASSMCMVGSFLYMSPEMLTRKDLRKHPLGPATDVHSFAIVMWRLFSSETHPYPGISTREQLIRLVVTLGGRPDLSVIRDSPSLQTLLTDCWAPNPSERPILERVHQRLTDLLWSPLEDGKSRQWAMKVWDEPDSYRRAFHLLFEKSQYESLWKLLCGVNDRYEPVPFGKYVTLLSRFAPFSSWDDIDHEIGQLARLCCFCLPCEQESAIEKLQPGQWLVRFASVSGQYAVTLRTTMSHNKLCSARVVHDRLTGRWSWTAHESYFGTLKELLASPPIQMPLNPAMMAGPFALYLSANGTVSDQTKRVTLAYLAQ